MHRLSPHQKAPIALHWLRHWGQPMRWVLLGLSIPLIVGVKSIQANPQNSQPPKTIQLHHQRSGENWICQPQGEKLLCDRSKTPPSTAEAPLSTQPSAQSSAQSSVQPTHGGTSASTAPSANSIMLKLIYIGLPIGCLTAIALHELWERHRTARMKAFIQRLERIWEESAQY